MIMIFKVDSFFANGTLEKRKKMKLEIMPII